MTGPKNPSASAEAARLEDELIQSILNAPGDELREYLVAIGEDPATAIADIEAAIQRAISTCGQTHLHRAKAELLVWQRQQAGSLFAPPAARQAIINQVRSVPAGVPMMLAARKGKNLSPSDEEGLADDFEEAERLERDADKE